MSWPAEVAFHQEPEVAPKSINLILEVEKVGVETRVMGPSYRESSLGDIKEWAISFPANWSMRQQKFYHYGSRYIFFRFLLLFSSCLRPE